MIKDEDEAPSNTVTNLLVRLRDHAEAHKYIAWQDDQQMQWMKDLLDAASHIEKLRELLSRLVTEIDGLAWESSGTYGLQINPNRSPLDEIPKGRLERLTSLIDARELLSTNSDVDVSQ
jgi:hypothetical protein